MKDIKNYEGIYAITEDGRVWSYRNNMWLKPSTHYKGYQVVCLSVNGKAESFFVHRLVAEAYIPNPENLPEVNHKNEDKSKNHVENLEWTDRLRNINYGTAMARASKTKSKRTYCLELDKYFDSVLEAAQYTNIPKSSISQCCTQRRPLAGGYHWRYV